MHTSDVILIVLAILMCGVSFYLLEKDQSKITKSMLIYSVIAVLIVVGITLTLIYVYDDNTLIFNLKRICLLSILWAVAYTDFMEYRIPNKFIILGFIYRALLILPELILEEQILVNLISEIIATIAILLATGLCRLMIKNAIGAGDMKLFMVMGLLLGLDGIWGAIFMSLIISFVIAVFLLITKKKSRNDNIPFGPAIALGTFGSVFLTGM